MKYSLVHVVSVAILCSTPIVANSLTYFDCINSDGSVVYRIEPCLPGQIEKRHFQVDAEKSDNSRKESAGYVAPRRENLNHEGSDQNLTVSTTPANPPTNTNAGPNTELTRTGSLSWRAYMQEVNRKLMPFISSIPLMDEKGSVQAVVYIRRDGSIGEIKIKSATGPQEIADNFQKAILKAQPLPPPPMELLNNGIYQLTFNYSPIVKGSGASHKPTNSDPIPGASSDDCFPAKYFSKDINGIEIEWRRMSLKGYTCESMLKSQDQIVNPADGFVALYISTDYSWRNFAYLHRKDNQFTLLPLNYSPVDPDKIYISRDIGTLASRHDAVEGKYYLYVPGVYFAAQSWDKSLPNWEHFDGWWLDVKQGKIEHIVLPTGPWVTDAKLDELFLRAFRNFSCGVECYRHYDIKVDGGNIYVSISGTPAAIHENVTGTFKLRRGSTNWEKVKE